MIQSYKDKYLKYKMKYKMKYKELQSLCGGDNGLKVIYANVGRDFEFEENKAVSFRIANCNIPGTAEITLHNIKLCVDKVKVTSPDIFIFVEFCYSQLHELIDYMEQEIPQYNLLLIAQNRNLEIYNDPNKIGYHPPIFGLQVDSYYKCYGYIYRRDLLEFNERKTLEHIRRTEINSISHINGYTQNHIHISGSEHIRFKPIHRTDMQEYITIKNVDGTISNAQPLSDAERRRQRFVNVTVLDRYSYYHTGTTSNISRCILQYCGIAVFNVREVGSMRIFLPHFIGSYGVIDSWNTQFRNICENIDINHDRFILFGDMNIRTTENPNITQNEIIQRCIDNHLCDDFNLEHIRLFTKYDVIENTLLLTDMENRLGQIDDRLKLNNHCVIFVEFLMYNKLIPPVRKRPYHQPESDRTSESSMYLIPPMMRPPPGLQVPPHYAPPHYAPPHYAPHMMRPPPGLQVPPHYAPPMMGPPPGLQVPPHYPPPIMGPPPGLQVPPHYGPHMRPPPGLQQPHYAQPMMGPPPGLQVPPHMMGPPPGLQVPPPMMGPPPGLQVPPQMTRPSPYYMPPLPMGPPQVHPLMQLFNTQQPMQYYRFN